MHEDIKFMLIGTEVSEDDYEDNLSKFLDKYGYELEVDTPEGDKIHKRGFIYKDNWWNNHLAVIKKEHTSRVFLEDGEVLEENIIVISDIILNKNI